MNTDYFDWEVLNCIADNNGIDRDKICRLISSKRWRTLAALLRLEKLGLVRKQPLFTGKPGRPFVIYYIVKVVRKKGEKILNDS